MRELTGVGATDVVDFDFTKHRIYHFMLVFDKDAQV